MVLSLADPLANDEFQPVWAKPAIPRVREYDPGVERWRTALEQTMPPELRRRKDAAQLLDKALWTMTPESGGNEKAVGDGGAAYGLFQSHHIPPGSDVTTQLNDFWRMVQNNPQQWTDWGENNLYQGKVFGGLGNYPYNPDPKAAPPLHSDYVATTTTYAPSANESVTGSLLGHDIANPNDNGTILEKLQAARVEREVKARALLGGYDPVITPPDVGGGGLADTTGLAGGGAVGGILGKPLTPAEQEQKAAIARATAKLGGGITDSLGLPSGQDVIGAGLKYGAKIADTLGNLPVAATGPGGAAINAISPLLGGQDNPTVGDVWSADIPGSKAVRDQVGQVQGAHLLARSGVLDKVGIDSGGLPSAGDVLSGFVPTTVGAAVTNLVGAKSADEALLGVKLLSREGGLFHIPGTAKAGAAMYSDVAQAAARQGAQEVAGVAGAGGGAVPRAALGRGAQEERYGAQVRAAVVDKMGADRAGAIETGLIKNNQTWADFGDAQRAFDPATPAWERRPAEPSVASFTGDPNNPADVAAHIRQGQVDLQAERAGTGARQQMQQARARMGGENSMLPREGSNRGTPSNLGGGTARTAPTFESELASVSPITIGGQKGTRTPGLSRRGTPGEVAKGRWESPDGPSVSLVAYGPDGKAVGVFTGVESGPNQGLFKITVSPEARRQGVGSKLLDEATAAGFDVARYAGKNNYTTEGRALVERWLGDMGGRADVASKLAPQPRPTTQWGINTADGRSYQVETKAGPVSSSTEEARARLARNTADQRALNTRNAVDRRVGAAQQAQEGVAVVRAGQDPRVDYSKLAPVDTLPPPTGRGTVSTMNSGWVDPQGKVWYVKGDLEHAKSLKQGSNSIAPLVDDGWARINRTRQGFYEIAANDRATVERAVTALMENGGIKPKDWVSIDVMPPGSNSVRGGQSFRGPVQDFLSGEARLRGPRPAIGGENSVVARQGVGRPAEHATDEAWAARIEHATSMAEKGADHRFWYDNSSAGILGMAHGDIQDADLIARMAAVGSNKMSVPLQGQTILQGWQDWKAGREVKRGAFMGPVSKRVDAAMRMTNDQWDNYVIGMIKKGDNQKVTNFWLDMMDSIDPVRAAKVREASGATVTVDAQMMRAFGFATTEYKSPTAAQYREIAAGIQDVATRMGWTPKQAQAAIWVQQIVENGKPLSEASVDYGSTILAHQTRLAQEVLPSPGTPRFGVVGPVLENAPPEALAAHAQAIDRAFRDDNGYDILGKAMDLPVDPVHGNPLAGAPNIAGVVDAEQAAKIDAYAIARATALGQDDTTWIRPFNFKSAGLHNAMDVNLTRAVTQDELDALRNELPDLVVIPSDKGVTIMRSPADADYAARVEGVAKHMDVNALNKTTQQRVQKATDALFDEAAFDGKIETFAADGKRIDLGSPDSLHTSTLERPDVRAAVSEIQQRVAAADDALVASVRDQAPGTGRIGASDSGPLEQRGRPGVPNGGAAAVPGQLPPGDGLHTPTGLPGQAEPGAVGPGGLRRDTLPEGRPPSGSGLEPGLDAARNFQFADPFHPTPEELQRFSEVGGAELLAEANRLDQTGVTPKLGGLISDAATLAKRLGDPAGELRRQLQQNGIIPGGENNNQRRTPPTQPALGDILEQAPKAPGEPPASHWEVLAREARGVLGLPRTIMTAADVGAILRNIPILGARMPGEFLKASKATVMAFKDEAAALAAKDAVESSPLFKDATERAGLKLWSWGPGIESANRLPGYEGLNASTVSKWVEKAPWIKGSERAMATAQNVMGMKTFEKWAQPILDMEKAGTLTTEQATKRLTDLASVINHSRGFSGSKVAEVAGALNFFFSAQFTASRFQVVADPLVMMFRGSPEARNLAAQSLLSFAGSNALMLGTLGMAGEKSGLWSVNVDPRSSDFGQLKVGNTRYDTLAGLGPLIKVLARSGAVATDALSGGRTNLALDQRTIGDLIKSYFENKAQPVAKVVTDFIEQNKLPKATDIPAMFAPMLATGIIETLNNERGSSLLSPSPLGIANAAAGAVASAFGAGANTYANASDVMEQKSHELLNKPLDQATATERLKVVDSLPEDVQKSGRKAEKARYDEALSGAGYKAPPKDKDGNPAPEDPDVMKARVAKNAEVMAANSELDVQRWYWGGKNTTSLNSKAAVDQALQLGIKDRKVTYQGTTRNLAASDADRAAWKAYGHVLQAVDEAQTNRDNLQAFASFMYDGKKYADLKPAEQAQVQSRIGQEANKDPKVAALQVFFGAKGPDSSGELTVTGAVAAELKKLWAEFPKAAQTPKKAKIVVKG